MFKAASFKPASFKPGAWKFDGLVGDEGAGFGVLLRRRRRR
jgi:hypothetical protein